VLARNTYRKSCCTDVRVLPSGSKMPVGSFATACSPEPYADETPMRVIE